MRAVRSPCAFVYLPVMMLRRKGERMIDPIGVSGRCHRQKVRERERYRVLNSFADDQLTAGCGVTARDGGAFRFPPVVRFGRAESRGGGASHSTTPKSRRPFSRSVLA